MGGLRLWSRRRDRLGRTYLIGERIRDLLTLQVWGLCLIWEHMLLWTHRVGLSRRPHLLLKKALLIGLQTGSCLCPQSLGELGHLSHIPLLHLLHVMLHPLLLLLLLLGWVSNSLGLLELVVVGHAWANSWPCSLLLHHLTS